MLQTKRYLSVGTSTQLPERVSTCKPGADSPDRMVSIP